jgi:molybdopterin-guanine dinucleotide biosynthesis protein A
LKITGIILAGGRNRRMGQNKAFLLVEGRRIIDRTSSLFAELFEEIILVTNSPLDYLDLNLRTVTDLRPGCASLGGVYTGLFHASHPHAFVAACDLPFLNQTLIQHLCNLRAGFDIVIPRTVDGLEPLHAVYSRRCLPFMEELLQAGNLKILDFLPRVKCREVGPAELLPFDPRLSSFFNVNTPEDLDRLAHFGPSPADPHR